MAHVFDAARDHHVGGAVRDRACTGGHGREGARAHPVDRVARDRLRQSGQECDIAAECQALVADLRRGGVHDVVDALGWERGVAAQELAHDLRAHVVGARLPEQTLGARAPEGGADTVDVDHLAELASHPSDLSPAD
jgi:hypothetical protein